MTPLLLAVAIPSVSAAPLSHEAFGTIGRGATVCVGPLSPSDAGGVQLVGATTGTSNLTWQVYTTSSETADALVFSFTGTSVDEVIAPSGSFLYRACVSRAPRVGEDFELALRSQES
jgi:hypothetical protein